MSNWMHVRNWFKWINQLDAGINNRFIACCLYTAQHVSGILMLIIRSLSTVAAFSGLPLERGGSSAVGRGLSGPDRPRQTALLTPRSYGKPEAAATVDRLLMMSIRMPETCWLVSKRQAINLLLIAASSWLIYLNVWRYTDLQTLNVRNWIISQIVDLLSLFKQTLHPTSCFHNASEKQVWMCCYISSCFITCSQEDPSYTNSANLKRTSE